MSWWRLKSGNIKWNTDSIFIRHDDECVLLSLPASLSFYNEISLCSWSEDFSIHSNYFKCIGFPSTVTSNVAQVHWKSRKIPSLLNITTEREREKPEERVCVDERDLAHRTHSPSLHTQSSSASLSTSMFKCLHPILRLDLVSHSITKSMLNKWKCDKQPKQSSVTHSER